LPKPDGLPQQALDHMSDRALSNQIEKGHIQPPVNIVWDNPLTDFDTLHGTAGKADVFVFDVGAEVAAGIGTIIHGTHVMNEYVYGFESGLDQIAFVNVPQDFIYAETNLGSTRITYGDPAIRDGFVYIESNPTSPWLQHINTIDSGNVPPDITVSHDYTITLLNGQQYTLPQDPWLLT
jgi:hypothetical protein